MSSVIRGSDNFDTSDNATQTELDAFESYTDSDALTLFNASGSAPVYACRAWVNFDGTGSNAIRNSGNVSSITDNGTGDYSVNFSTAMVDTHYAVTGSANALLNATGTYVRMMSPITLSTTYFRCIISHTNANKEDGKYVGIVFMR